MQHLVVAFKVLPRHTGGWPRKRGTPCPAPYLGCQISWQHNNEISVIVTYQDRDINLTLATETALFPDEGRENKIKFHNNFLCARGMDTQSRGGVHSVMHQA